MSKSSVIVTPEAQPENTTTIVEYNATEPTKTLPITSNYVELLFCYVMTAIFLALALYLLISAVTYQFKQLIQASREGTTRHSGNQWKSKSWVIEGTLIFCIFTSIVRLILDFLTEGSCVISLGVNISLAATCLGCVYFILWRRQRILYAHRTMLLFASRVPNILSWLTLALILLSFVINIVLFVVLGINYSPTQNYQCEFGPSSQRTSVKWITLAASTVIFQSILFGLLAYPLCAHESSLHESNVMRPSTCIRSLFRRLVITMVICIITDIIVATVASLVKRPTGEINSLAYTIDITVNIVCIICSFSDWRSRLMPFRNFCAKPPMPSENEEQVVGETI